MSKLLWICLLLTLASCSPSKVIENQLAPQERNAVRGAINDVSRGDAAALYRKMPPELALQLQNVMPEMHRAMPAGPLDISLLDASWWVAGKGPRTARMTYQVHGTTGWAIVRAATVEQGDKAILTTLYVNKVQDDPKKLNRFRLAGAGVNQWLVLLTAIAAFTTTVAALIRIWRSGLFQRRWLWTIGALFGVMLLRINWTTGQLFFQPFYVQLFSAGAYKQPVFAPWVISASLPLVAIIALLRKRGSLEEPHDQHVADLD